MPLPSQSISIGPIWILFSQHYLGFPIGLFPTGFPAITLCSFLSSLTKLPTLLEVSFHFSFCLLYPMSNFCFVWFDSPSGPRRLSRWGFEITLRHTTLGRTPLDKGSARRRDLHLTTYNKHKRQTFVPPGVMRSHNPSTRATPQTCQVSTGS